MLATVQDLCRTRADLADVPQEFLCIEDLLAEGVGFEPTSDFRRCRFSSALLSVMLRARQCQRV